MKFYIQATAGTEELIQLIIDEIKNNGMSEDEALDAIEIDREQAPAGGVTNEPITVAAILTFATGLIIPATRAIEKWMELSHQRKVLKIIVDAGAAGQDVTHTTDLLKKYADISIYQGPLPEIGKNVK